MAVTISLQLGDITTAHVDLLVAKYAQDFYGADLAVASALAGCSGWDLSGFTAPAGEYRLIQTNGELPSREVLFIGTKPLSLFDYAAVENLGFRALVFVTKERPYIRTIAMTLHGPGFGLDEQECFAALLRGLNSAIRSRFCPVELRSITIMEHNPSRVKRLLRTSVPAESAKSEPAQSPPLLASEKAHAFIAMPFSEQYEDLYYYGIQSAVQQTGYLSERIDLTAFTGDIMDRIKGRIQSASFIVAELTDANANVYLEVGYAWGKGRPTVLLARDSAELKFDIGGQRCLKYKNIRDLEKRLLDEIIELRRTGVLAS